MKEFKGTKGEWIATDSDSIKTTQGELVALSTTLIERVDETKLGGESWLAMRDRTKGERELCDAERKANAKIIAAAPELLEALQLALSDLSYYYDNCEVEGSMLIRSNIDKIKQAINKAL